MPDVVAAIDININPEIVGGLTWHGFFTALGIALGVWLALRYARRVGITEDDGMAIALVAVPAGIVGARTLWVLEHTDQIHNVGDLFALTDGGISVYGAMIGGVIGGFVYVVLFRKQFPRWMALDAAAPGMLLGQAVGRFGDVINGEHFARASDLPWAFRYTNPHTDGPWGIVTDGRIPPASTWQRGSAGLPGEQPIAVHPVASGYEPIVDFLLLGVLIWLWRSGRVRHGWIFVTYVMGYALIRGLLAILRSDEQTIVADLSVPQFLAVLTALGAAVMAWYLWRRPQPRVGSTAEQVAEARAEAREEGRARRAEQQDASERSGSARVGARRARRRGGGR